MIYLCWRDNRPVACLRYVLADSFELAAIAYCGSHLRSLICRADPLPPGSPQPPRRLAKGHRLTYQVEFKNGDRAIVYVREMDDMSPLAEVREAAFARITMEALRCRMVVV